MSELSAEQAERVALALLHVLDLSQSPLLICDSTLQVLTATCAARTILLQRDGLSIHQGQLLAEGCCGTVSLRRRVARLAAGGPGLRPLESLRVRRSRGVGDYELLLCPVEDPMPEQPLARNLVLVFVRDPECTPRPSPNLLQQLHGLTTREAQVLDLLVAGLAPARIAESLRVGTETVKSHLRALYGKTNTNSQAQLVGAALSGLGRFVRALPGTPAQGCKSEWQVVQPRVSMLQHTAMTRPGPKRWVAEHVAEQQHDKAQQRIARTGD